MEKSVLIIWNHPDAKPVSDMDVLDLVAITLRDDGCDATVLVCNEVVIHAFRAALKQGKLDSLSVTILPEDTTYDADKDGRFDTEFWVELNQCGGGLVEEMLIEIL